MEPVTYFFYPVSYGGYEVATASGRMLAWRDTQAKALQMAYRYARHVGHRTAHSRVRARRPK